MHTDAKRFLDRIQDPKTRAQFALFLDYFDAMDRENTHLRVMLQGQDGCPYGFFQATGCSLGYPGCACMDDMLAMQSWSPQDENKAAVRIGRQLIATRRMLDDCRRALDTAAGHLEERNAPPLIVQACRQAAQAQLTDLRRDA